VATIPHVSTLKEPHRKQSRVTSWRCTMCTMGADDHSFVDEQSPSLRQIIDSAPALIHTSRPDGYLDFFNQGWLNFVGQPLEKLLGWKWTSWIHPEDVESFVQKWRESIATGEGFEGTARVRRADGVYRWMLPTNSRCALEMEEFSSGRLPRTGPVVSRTTQVFPIPLGKKRQAT
jgi:PAS domain S-box-containing protein